MARFTAKMEHNAGTIEKLVEMQQRTFQFGRRIARLAIAMLLILYGLYADKSMFTPYLALLAGCILLTSGGVRTKRQTQQILKEIGGNFPRSEYTFSEEGFTFYDKGEPIGYDKLYRLVEDPEYLYLYVSRQSAYMVDRATVSGGDCGGLKRFLEEKSGLRWSRPNTLLNFNIRTLLPGRKTEKRAGEQEGYTQEDLRSLERERERQQRRGKKKK